MPFKSEKQRKWMHANEPEMAKDWEKKESLKENSTKLVKNLMQIYKDLDKKFKNYDHTKMRDWGNVTKHLIKKFGGNNRLASHISTSYNDYRGGEDIKKNITNLIKYSQKMTGKKLEATTTSVVPPHNTPDAFRKSTYKAIQVDDEDDSDELLGGIKDYRKKIAKLDKKESVNEEYGDLNDNGFKKVKKYNKIAIKLVKKIENAVRRSEGKDAVKWIRGLYDAVGIMYDTIGHKMYYESINESIKVRNGESVRPGMWEVFDTHTGKSIKVVKTASSATRLMNRLMNSGQYNEITTKWLGETVDEAGISMKMKPFSSSEARQHINQDIKKMSKFLGKASQQSIKLMMDGVKGGKYTAMDISRGIKEGPVSRTHFGELGFIQQLWNKVRDKFRRYSKDRKLS